jgi:hypothetical protein
MNIQTMELFPHIHPSHVICINETSYRIFAISLYKLSALNSIGKWHLLFREYPLVYSPTVNHVVMFMGNAQKKGP